MPSTKGYKVIETLNEDTLTLVQRAESTQDSTHIIVQTFKTSEDAIRHLFQ